MTESDLDDLELQAGRLYLQWKYFPRRRWRERLALRARYHTAYRAYADARRSSVKRSS